MGILPGAGGLGDQSFNDMAYAGLGKARKIQRFNLIHEETGVLSSRHSDSVVTRWLDTIYCSPIFRFGLFAKPSIVNCKKELFI